MENTCGHLRLILQGQQETREVLRLACVCARKAQMLTLYPLLWFSLMCQSLHSSDQEGQVRQCNQRNRIQLSELKAESRYGS